MNIESRLDEIKQKIEKSKVTIEISKDNIEKIKNRKQELEEQCMSKFNCTLKDLSKHKTQLEIEINHELQEIEDFLNEDES
jgi:hypothetical protein